MLTIEIITNKLKSLTNFDFKVEHYNSQSDSNISFVCEYGHNFSKSWRSIQSGKISCTICNRIKLSEDNRTRFIGNKFNEIKYDTKFVKEQMMQYGYILNSEYTQANIKLNTTCPLGHSYDVSWSKFRCGRRCSICRGNSKHDILEAHTGVTSKTKTQIQKVINSHGFKWINQNDYVNRSSKITATCNIGHCFNTTWYLMSNNGIQSIYCPICKPVSFSIGEMSICSVLDKMKIHYEREKTYSDLRSDVNGILRYDFYIPHLNTLIEYDGSHHFYAHKKFGGEKHFELVKKNDDIKNKHALKNNIKLIRIPFTHYNYIQEIIKDVVNNGNNHTNLIIV